MHTHETILGHNVQDSITQFKGMATGYLYYMTGCNQVLVQPSVTDKGELPEGKWFDVQRLNVTSDSRLYLDNGQTPGSMSSPPAGHRT